MNRNQPQKLHIIPPAALPENRKSNKAVVGIIAAVVGLFVLGGLFLWQMQSASPDVSQGGSPPPPPPVPSPQSGTEVLDTSDWQTYTNPTHGYSIKFPDAYEVPPQTERQKSQLGIDQNMCIREVKTKTCTISINYSQKSVVEILQLNLPTDGSKPQDYPIGDIKGKMIAYKVGESTTDVLIVIPKPNSEKQTITFSYRNYPGDVETSEVILQILSTFRFVDIVSEIEDYLPLYLDYNTGTGGFGYTSERIGLVKEVEDINGDGVNEVFATASGSGGSCVGGSNYSILYSPKDKEYFIRAGSFLPPPPPPVDNNTNFCTNIEQNQAWEGCGNDYVSAICYSNNLKEEENTAFKEYLDNVISQE